MLWELRELLVPATTHATAPNGGVLAAHAGMGGGPLHHRSIVATIVLWHRGPSFYPSRLE